MTTEPHLPPSCAQRFRPERVLAQGGYGTVWLAYQISLDRQVAVKVLHGEVLADDTAVKRFLNEARVTAQLTHPNIVVLMDHDVEDGVPWIAYEYVPGKSLRTKLEGGRLPWREAVGIALQIAAALEAAHAHGVLHRDIKPDNVLEAEDGHFKVADFGIARHQDMTGLTAKGQIVGTPAYLSPVQLRGEVPGPESDIYALGVTLYELLTGELPFNDADVLRLLERHMVQTPPKPSAKVEGLPAGLDALVLKALAKRREERFDQVAEMSTALRALLGPEDEPRRNSGMTRSVAVSAGSSGRHQRTARRSIATIAPARPASAPAAASPWRMVAAAACGALLAAFALRSPAAVAPPAPSPAALGTPSAAPPASPTPTLASEPPTRLRDFHLVFGIQTLGAVIHRDQPVELIVTLREEQGGSPPRTVRVPPLPLRARLTFERLRAGRRHTVTVQTAGGKPLVASFPFETKAMSRPSPPISAKEFLANSLVAKFKLREAMDDSFVPTLLAVAAQVDPDSGPMDEVALLARDMRHPELAAALFRRLSEVTSPGSRASIVSSALYCDLPGAEASAEAELPRVDKSGLELIILPLSGRPNVSLATALIAALDRVGTARGGHAGAALAEMAPDLALKTFERWLKMPADAAHGELQWSAEEGLRLLGPGRARPVVARLLGDPRTLAAGLGAAAAVGDGHRDLVERTVEAHPIDVRVQQTAAYLGSPLSVAYWAQEALEGIGNRRRAATMLAGPDSPARRAALRRVLASPDAAVASAAAWAAGQSRIGGLTAELARIDDARDRTHYALWARARTGDRTAAPAIVAALKAVAAQPRTADTSYRLLAAAAAELRAADAAAALDVMLARRNDSCLSAARAHLTDGTRRFAVLHPAVSIVRTGVKLEASESVTIHGWSLEDVQPDIVNLFKSRKLGIHFLVEDDAPWELRDQPHPILATVGYEVKISRTQRIALDEPNEKNRGAFLIEIR